MLNEVRIEVGPLPADDASDTWRPRPRTRQVTRDPDRRGNLPEVARHVGFETLSRRANSSTRNGRGDGRQPADQEREAHDDRHHVARTAPIVRRSHHRHHGWNRRLLQPSSPGHSPVTRVRQWLNAVHGASVRSCARRRSKGHGSWTSRRLSSTPDRSHRYRPPVQRAIGIVEERHPLPVDLEEPQGMEVRQLVMQEVAPVIQGDRADACLDTERDAPKASDRQGDRRLAQTVQRPDAQVRAIERRCLFGRDRLGVRVGQLARLQVVELDAALLLIDPSDVGEPIGQRGERRAARGGGRRVRGR